MIRRQRRAEGAKARKPPDRAELIRIAVANLVRMAADDPAVSPVTLILPSGEIICIDRADSLAVDGEGPTRGRT